MRDMIRSVNAQADRIDFLVHTVGVCRRDTAPEPMSEDERFAMNEINQIAPSEITLGLEEKNVSGPVILSIGSAVEDIRWECAAVYGDAKKGFHHFAARYASGRQ